MRGGMNKIPNGTHTVSLCRMYVNRKRSRTGGTASHDGRDTTHVTPNVETPKRHQGTRGPCAPEAPLDDSTTHYANKF